MKRFAMPWVVLALLGALAACRSGPAPDSTAPPKGTALFTQFTLQQEQDRFRTTNYRRGLLLPINSEVTFLAMNSREIEVEVKASGRRLVIENVPKHTGESTGQAFRKLFADKPVDLSRFSDAERTAIRAGLAERGMSRDAVIAALGYPPAVGTPTLDSKAWKYWDSRFTTFDVLFDDAGRVADAGR